MWLKRKKAPSAEIPKLRDEYAKLLQETLPDVGRLQDVVQTADCAEEQFQWRAHQRALQPFIDSAALHRKRFARLGEGSDAQMAHAEVVS